MKDCLYSFLHDIEPSGESEMWGILSAMYIAWYTEMVKL